MERLKNDKYRKARGGKAFLIEVFCATCQTYLLRYQKDGDGPLKRCYLNRIAAPPELERLQHNADLTDPARVPPLTCQKCRTVIGVAILHHDGRVAFRLRQGFFSKKRITK